jgi:signal transduction histidine kinase
MQKEIKNKLVFRDIFSYFFIGFVLCCIALLFTSYYSYKTIYNQAIEESSAAIKGAITTEQRKMSNLAESYGQWTQVYAHVVQSLDLPWIENNIAQDMHDDFMIPYVAIFNNDKDFTTLYSNNELFGTSQKLAPNAMAELLEAFKKEQHKLKSKTQFIQNENQIYLTTVTKITNGEKNSKFAFLILIKPITEQYMDQVSEDYALSNIDLVIPADQSRVEPVPGLSIKHNDKVIGYMTWSPRDSASNILKVLIPTGLLVILLLTVIGVMVTQKIIKASTNYTKMIEDLAQTASELMKAKEKSDQSSQAKTRFLSMMSHEIKTPMNGLMGMIALLKDTELNETQIHYVNTMENSSESLLKLIDNILEFSKLESGNASIMFNDINIRQMIAEIHQLLMPVSIQKKLKFEVNFDDHVPLLIRSDAIRLRQMILHLVTNALKFTKVGSVRINVTATNINQNHCELGIQVIDTGIGIPDGIKEILFQDFFRIGDSINHSYNGAGLGLNIVKHLASLLGAKVGVESKLGQGSVFWVQFEVETISKLASADNSPINSSANTSLNILLVEEEDTAGSYTRNLLEKVGNNVESAANASVAANMINSKAYDVIMLNIPENDSLRGDFSPLIIKTAMPGKNSPPIVGISKEENNSYDTHQYDHIIHTPLTSSKLKAALLETIKSKQIH